MLAGQSYAPLGSEPDATLSGGGASGISQFEFTCGRAQTEVPMRLERTRDGHCVFVAPGIVGCTVAHRENQRSAGFINEDAVRFVDDRKVQATQQQSVRAFT